MIIDKNTCLADIPEEYITPDGLRINGELITYAEIRDGLVVNTDSCVTVDYQTFAEVFRHRHPDTDVEHVLREFTRMDPYSIIAEHLDDWV